MKSMDNCGKETRQSRRLAEQRESPSLLSEIVPRAFAGLFFAAEPPELFSLGRRKLERLHASPHIYKCDDFLSETELCFMANYIEQRRESLERSFTSGHSGGVVVDGMRTSRFLAVPKFLCKTTMAIERRASEIFGLDEDCVEPLQIVAYESSEFFDVHHDSGTLSGGGIGYLTEATKSNKDKRNPTFGADEHRQDGCSSSVLLLDEEEGTYLRRLVTVFVYLNSVPESGGGETVFPLLHRTGRGASDGTNLKELRGLHGRVFHPVRGRALFWCNYAADGKPDPRLIHLARPIKPPYKKYGINIWLTDTSHAEDLSSSRDLNKPRKKRKTKLKMKKSPVPLLFENQICEV